MGTARHPWISVNKQWRPEGPLGYIDYSGDPSGRDHSHISTRGIARCSRISLNPWLHSFALSGRLFRHALRKNLILLSVNSVSSVSSVAIFRWLFSDCQRQFRDHLMDLT